MNDVVHTQCLRADVGGVRFAVHLGQSEAPFFDCFLAPQSRCFTQQDPRLVIMPRATFESVCPRCVLGQPISSRNCCSWNPHAAARDVAYISASRPEREMTPCVVELVSSTEFPSLTMTQSAALAFRLLRSLIAVSGYVKELWRLLNGTRPCKMRCVYSEPRNAWRWSQSTMRSANHVSNEILNRVQYVRSVRRQIAQYTNETAHSGSVRFINKFICITSFGMVHHKRRHTFRSNTPKFAHLHCLLGLCWMSRPREPVCVHSSESCV